MLATIDDLRMELWFRRRNAGEIRWKTKEGLEIPINQMSDSHIVEAIKCVRDLREMRDIVMEDWFEVQNAGDR